MEAELLSQERAENLKVFFCSFSLIIFLTYKIIFFKYPTPLAPIYKGPPRAHSTQGPPAIERSNYIRE